MIEGIVRKTIERNYLIEEEDNIVVGVSGGHDSVTLLTILKKLSKKMKFNLFVAHINHGVRGVESDEDEQYVKDMCKYIKVPFYSKTINMVEYGIKHKLSPEEAGRNIRYSFFQSIIENKLGSGKIAVAHNQNDQGETIFLNFIRGTGLNGLCGMEYESNNIIRPLLDVDRSEIEKYCLENKLNPRTDSTNFERVYRRNKIRLDVIPYIEDNFNRNITETIVRMGRTLKNDLRYLEIVAYNEYNRVKNHKKKDLLEIDNEKFVKLDISIKARVIRIALKEIIGSLKGVTQKNILRVVKLSENEETGKSVNIIKDYMAKISYKKLILEKIGKLEKIGYNYKVYSEGTIDVKELDKKLISRLIERKDLSSEKRSKFKEFFDFELIKKDIILRSRKEGDKISLKGINGRKKLKDYYIDNKISTSKRDRIPLLEINEEIAWVIGYRKSENYVLGDKVEKILVIELR